MYKKMNRKTLLSLILILMCMSVTLFAQDSAWTAEQQNGVAKKTEVQVDVAKEYQQMQGFGTCLKTWGNRGKDPVVAGQYDEDLLKRYAQDAGMSIIRIPLSKWVYESENPYGVPAAATKEGMSDPEKISHKDFMWKTDHGRAAGQLTYSFDFIKGIKKYRDDVRVIGTVWSPPHWMKEAAPSGPGQKYHWSEFGSESCGGRLKRDHYEHFAHYLVEYIKGLKEVHDIELYAVSPQNELLFYEPYDSCVYTPEEYANLLVVIAEVFKEEEIKTKVFGPEDMTKFPDRTVGFLRALMQKPEAAELLYAVASHGYSDGIETSLQADDSEKLWQMMEKISPDKEFWMTETGGGAGTWTDIETVYASGKNKGKKQIIPGALSGLATMIHNALYSGNASLWTNWQFLDGGEHTSHGLVKVSAGKPDFTKKYQVMKHFARWTPRDSRRIEISDPGDGLLAIAFRHEDKKVSTVILQNHQEAAVQFQFSGLPESGSYAAYLTDAKRDCAEGQVEVKDGAGTLVLPARSIVTLTNAE